MLIPADCWLRCRARLVMLISLAALSACQPASRLESVSFTGLVMGTDYRITVLVPVKTDLAALEQQVVGELQAVNNSMSTYLVNSEVSRFNRLPANMEFELSEPLRAVISEALEISALSDGAFDITVANAVRIWGFGPDGAISTVPDDSQLLELSAITGYQHLQLNGNRLAKDHAATAIDLSAIAKGYAVDQVARMLVSQGLHNHLVEVGGELRAGGKNIEQRAWRVAIEKPVLTGGVQQVLDLQNNAIASSGDYRNFLTIDGIRYSHTIDPLSLRPVLHRLASVTVVSDNTSTADALATTLMVMGEERGPEFAERLELAAYFIIHDLTGSGFNIKTTRKFDALLR